MRAIALALVVSLSGCTFAVEHPAATAGILGGSIGFGTCEVGTDFDEHASCGLVGAGAALVLGGVVLLATLLGGEGNTVLTQPTSELPQRPEPPSIDDPQPAPADTPTTTSPTTSPTPIAPTP